MRSMATVALAFAILLAGSGEDARAASKGKVICIGLTHVDPKHYGDDSGKLSGCDNDAKDMLDIGSKALHDPGTLLLNEQATRQSVIDAITGAGATLVSGDILMVYYSGHGGQIPDETADAQNKMDQTWCLFDGQLLDKELYQLFSQFRSGVRILVISDSCHSEGISKQLALEYKAAIALKGADAQPPIGAIVKSQHFDLKLEQEPKFRVKQLSPITIIKTYLNNQQMYDDLLTKVKTDAPTPPINPWVLSISACKDDETSGDAGTGRNSVFTAALKLVWNDGKYRSDGNYLSFQNDIAEAAAIARPSQHAVSRMIDVDLMSYWWQYPFTLGAP